VDKRCLGGHRFFVADTYAVPGEGKVGAIIICTACGEGRSQSFTVAAPSSHIQLLKGKENGRDLPQDREVDA